MSQEPLKTIEVTPTGGGKGSIIWLHGLGADGHDFEPIVPALGVPQARFVFPHAPIRPVTLNMGMKMRAWYDIISLDRDEEDFVGVQESAAQVMALIDQEVAKGRAPKDIILAGFSQGGAMALHAGLRYPEKLGGIIALSCYLPVASTYAEEVRAEAKDIPIFMAHGRFDPVVPLSLGQESHGFLKEKGHKLHWQTYPIQHNVSPQEIADIGRWLRLRLP